MKAVRVSEPGPAENLQILDVDIPVPKEGEVLLKVHYFGLNRADISQRYGKYPPPAGATNILGLEAVGEIVEDGQCSGQYYLTILVGGGYAQYVTVPREHLVPIPKGFELQNAAAIPEVWMTAFQLLTKVASLKPGDNVLIHAGASGVGTAAVQIVKDYGANPYVVVGTQDKIDYCKGLGALEGFNYKEDGEYYKKFLELTGGKGADIILDPVGASNFLKNAEMIALDGTWVLFGGLGGMVLENFDLKLLMRRRVRFLSSTLRARPIAYKTELARDFHAYAIPKFEDGVFKPIIDTVYNFDQIVEAHKKLESNTTIGKVLIKVDH